MDLVMMVLELLEMMLEAIEMMMESLEEWLEEVDCKRIEPCAVGLVGWHWLEEGRRSGRRRRRLGENEKATTCSRSGLRHSLLTHWQSLPRSIQSCILWNQWR